MKVESTAAVVVRNRETNHIDAVLAETTNASILTDPVHDRTESAILVHADDAPTSATD